MNRQKLSVLMEEVVAHLRTSGFEDDAVNLEQLITQINEGSADTATAVRDIQARCHVKWLGDVPVKDVSFNEWLQLLDRVKQAASSGI